MPGTLVLLRHGQSEWNHENRFTGWTDVELTERGVAEGRRAAHLLRESRIEIHGTFTSVLKRAIRTLWVVMSELDQVWLPEVHDWRLNERHYGALQGLSKDQVAAEIGDEEVFRLRRGYNVRPPALTFDDPRHPRFDPRYSSLDANQLPVSESLADTLDRVLICWNEQMAPCLHAGQNLLVVAHHNSLRALVKHLDGISPDDISVVNIPTGYPLIYRFNASLRPLSHHYLGNADEVRSAAEAVYRIPHAVRSRRPGQHWR